MAESDKAAKSAEVDKASAPPPPRPIEPEKAMSKKTKIVAETGRYICKHPVVFMSPDGKRTTARAGDVVAIHETDARSLKRRKIIENEEESAEA